MHALRFMRRALSRSTMRGESRHRLFLRPAVYLILAAGVCIAAATAPSHGKNDVASAAPGPVGNGFTVTPSDLAFILKQIKIAERHSRAYQGNPDPGTPVNPDPLGDPEYCQALVGPGPDQIPDRLTSYGLRTVDGSCNNLFPGRDKFAAVGRAVPAADDAGVQRRRGQPARLLRARQRHHPRLRRTRRSSRATWCSTRSRA